MGSPSTNKVSIQIQMGGDSEVALTYADEHLCLGDGVGLQERNKVGEKDRRGEAEDLAYIVQKQASEWLHEGSEVRLQGPSVRQPWRRPSTGFLKINTDGSFSTNTGSGGWGFVIRDELTTIAHAGAGSCQYLLSAFHCELLACVQGVMEAVKQGMSRVLLETDSQMVKMAFETNMFALADTGGIVYELKNMISSSFVEFKFLFTPRTCNSVAHVVAAFGCTCS
ncbi:hypothetical protein C2845_PM09G13220 [Panicum miliaceum]|uniref:RNase H type-1 domain-containing protein n=1 Tax=Panicum miliaceum TaxID=4540 RepID=A0A3L6S312_PANMI|nr:hypothetical protein C2845_PM09G13220 [Panicum miliaceum]